ncbi:MAG: hypothetical protein IPO75_12515 [Betaproteobacteria bacterium]|nr:hypothetical protein [Betaproteobacteria bacterium]
MRITIGTLLAAGRQREIARRTGVDRKTIRRLAGKFPGVATGSGGVRATPPGGPGGRAPGWIEAQVGLGRNAVSIYQDLVEAHGFEHATTR